MRFTCVSAAALPAGIWTWPHIDPATEWADTRTGQLLAESDFLDLLERLRAAFGRPIPIVSGYRTPAHNVEVSATASSFGPHTLGLAADIAVHGPAAFELLQHALALGFTGIGVAQKGPVASRYLHLDMAPNRPDAPRPLIWSY